MIFISANKQAAILSSHQRLKSHRKTLKLKTLTLSVKLSMDKFLLHSHRSVLQLMQSRRVVSDVARILKLETLTPYVHLRVESVVPLSFNLLYSYILSADQRRGAISSIALIVLVYYHEYSSSIASL